jgi:hypothetical protein
MGPSGRIRTSYAGRSRATATSSRWLATDAVVGGHGWYGRPALGHPRPRRYACGTVVRARHKRFRLDVLRSHSGAPLTGTSADGSAERSTQHVIEPVEGAACRSRQDTSPVESANSRMPTRSTAHFWTC